MIGKTKNEIKDDNPNLEPQNGPDIDRLLVSISICVALLIIAKALGY